MSTFYSRGRVAPETLRCGRWIDGVVPGSPREFHKFDLDVLWLYSSHSQEQLFVNGVFVKDGVTLNDFYGKGTSTGIIESDALPWAERLGIVGNGTVVIRVVTTVTKRAVRRAESPEWRTENCYSQIDDKILFGTDEELDAYAEFQSRKTFTDDDVTPPIGYLWEEIKVDSQTIWQSSDPEVKGNPRELFPMLFEEETNQK